jgi:alanyl-tRNA synthetase
VLLSTQPPLAAAVARSADVSLDAIAVLRTLMTSFGGRGGGKADLAQGAGLAGDVLAITDAARAALAVALR